jgi:hypothetical protein
VLRSCQRISNWRDVSVVSARKSTSVNKQILVFYTPPLL